MLYIFADRKIYKMNKIVTKILVGVLIGLLCVLFFLLYNAYSYRKTCNELFGTKITVPYVYMEHVLSATSDSVVKDKTYVLLIYSDSLDCNSCKISELKEWVSYCDKLSIRVHPIFVFSPQTNMLFHVRHKLIQTNCRLDAYIDINKCYEKYNPIISKKRVMHVLLLDSNYNVVLVGNPLINKYVSNLYSSL